MGVFRRGETDGQNRSVPMTNERESHVQASLQELLHARLVAQGTGATRPWRAPIVTRVSFGPDVISPTEPGSLVSLRAGLGPAPGERCCPDGREPQGARDDRLAPYWRIRSLPAVWTRPVVTRMPLDCTLGLLSRLGRRANGDGCTDVTTGWPSAASNSRPRSACGAFKRTIRSSLNTQHRHSRIERRPTASSNRVSDPSSPRAVVNS